MMALDVLIMATVGAVRFLSREPFGALDTAGLLDSISGLNAWVKNPSLGEFDDAKTQGRNQEDIEITDEEEELAK